MGVPDFACYDGSVSEAINPFRPGIDTVGGASFVDDSQYPPDPNTQLTARAENQNEFMIVALAKVTGCALLSVHVTAGVATIFGLRAASSILLPGDFTINNLGTGFYEFICPATKLIQPFGCIAVPQATGDFRASGYVNGGANGIRIETRNSAGTLTDMNFLAMWM